MKNSTTKTEVSAGGVAYRKRDGVIEVALINTGKNGRWQLPKGLLNQGENPEQAAVREVREETGLVTQVEAFLEKIEYWYYVRQPEGPTRIHKFVHFFLLTYIEGNVSDHDWEVNEARWVEIGLADEVLAFENEKEVVKKAGQKI